MNVIEETFAKLYGIPAWSVRQGHGSFLTFEFGQPILEIAEVGHHEPRPRFPATRSRQASVHGEWHLWVYCCSWSIEQEGSSIADSESSPDLIQLACNVLSGQSLTSVEVSQSKTVFKFDLGGLLQTRAEGYEPTDTSWMLFRPDRLTFSYRQDGHYSLAPSSTNSDGESWLPIFSS